MNRTLNINLFQYHCAFNNQIENYKKVTDLLTENFPGEKSVLIFPELFSTGFLTDSSLLTNEEVRSYASNDIAFLSTTAIESECYVIGSTLLPVEEPNTSTPKFLNLSITFDPDGIEIARYAKIHPFSHGNESTHFVGGETPLLYDLAPFRTQPTLCYDLRFPELTDWGVRGGANLLTVQAQWPAERSSQAEVLIRARAIETQSYALFTNVTGTVNNINYYGQSSVIGPDGSILKKLGSEEAVLSFDIDLDVLDNYRSKFNTLCDKKKIEFYRSLQSPSN